MREATQVDGVPYVWSHPDTNDVGSAGHGYRNVDRRVSGQVSSASLSLRRFTELAVEHVDDWISFSGLCVRDRLLQGRQRETLAARMVTR